MKTFAKTQYDVWHIELDVLDSNRFLFADYSSIKLTDGKATLTLVGAPDQGGYKEGEGQEARFNYITGFLQWNKTSIIVVDHQNHCIRTVDRQSWMTSKFVGYCQTNGSTDGIEALFNKPWSIIKHARSRRKVLVTDSDNDAIREIDIKKKTTKTLVRKGLKRPMGITFDSTKRNLLITNLHYLSKYHFGTKIVTKLTGSKTKGFADGALDEAMFESPSDAIFLTKNVILVADQHNHRLRVIDIDKNSVSSICTGFDAVDADGSIRTCKTTDPSSLLAHDGFIYIGQDSAIRTLQCK